MLSTCVGSGWDLASFDVLPVVRMRSMNDERGDETGAEWPPEGESVAHLQRCISPPFAPLH